MIKNIMYTSVAGESNIQNCVNCFFFTNVSVSFFFRAWLLMLSELLLSSYSDEFVYSDVRDQVE